MKESVTENRARMVNRGESSIVFKISHASHGPMNVSENGQGGTGQNGAH